MDKLFRLEGAAAQDRGVDGWLKAQKGELGDLARAWFSRMRACGEDVLELMHDGCPVVCVSDIPFAYVNVFTAHMNVGFFLGSELTDPAGLLEGAGRRMRHVKLKSSADSPEEFLDALIAAAYSDAKSRMTWPMSADVESAFQNFPPGIRRHLHGLRELIFQTAAGTDGVGRLTETLKWGEPAYLTADSGSGSTIRIGWKKSKPTQYALYFICRTDLVDTFRTRFPELRYEGNRAIVFEDTEDLPCETVEQCVEMALVHHLQKDGGTKKQGKLSPEKKDSIKQVSKKRNTK